MCIIIYGTLDKYINNYIVHFISPHPFYKMINVHFVGLVMMPLSCVSQTIVALKTVKAHHMMTKHQVTFQSEKCQFAVLCLLFAGTLSFIVTSFASTLVRIYPAGLNITQLVRQPQCSR